MLARYEDSTNTIRSIPENYCLVAWDENGNPLFDIDKATLQNRKIVKEAYGMWLTLDSDPKHKHAKHALAICISALMHSRQNFNKNL